MRLYPIQLNLHRKPVLVVGAGSVGLRKAQRLLEAGARVLVVTRKAHPQVLELERGTQPAGGWLHVEERNFRPDDLKGSFLVFACTDDRDLNQTILELANEQGILAQSATDPASNDFHVPSEIRRGEFSLAISTGGGSPALAKAIRERLEEIFPEAFGDYVELLARVRTRQLEQGELSDENAAKFRALVAGDLEAAVLAGDWDKAEQVLAEQLGAGFSLKELGLRE